MAATRTDPPPPPWDAAAAAAAQTGTALGMAVPALLLLLLLLLLPGVAGASCCYLAKSNLMCRDVCEQILSSKSDSHLKHLLQRAPEYCPESMGEVWGCINSSLPGVLKKSDGWVGLGCCELAIVVECRQACKQASSKNGILKICRKEYEEVDQYLLENGKDSKKFHQSKYFTPCM